MKILCCLACLLLAPIVVSAQDEKTIDQLREQYESAERDSVEIARQAHAKLNADESKNMAQQLHKSVEKAFELRNELRAAELDAAQENIDHAKALLDKRRAAASEIIQSRISELMRSSDLGWTPGELEGDGEEGLRNLEPPWQLGKVSTSDKVDGTAIHAYLAFGCDVDELELRSTQVINDQLHTKFAGGISVSSIQRDSLANAMGLRQNDTLLGINGWQTASHDDLNLIVARLLESKLDRVNFYVIRSPRILVGYVKVDAIRHGYSQAIQKMIAQESEVRENLFNTIEVMQDEIKRVSNLKPEDIELPDDFEPKEVLGIQVELVQVQAELEQVKQLVNDYKGKERDTDFWFRLKSLGDERANESEELMLASIKGEKEQQIRTLQAKIEAIGKLFADRYRSEELRKLTSTMKRGEARLQSEKERLKNTDRLLNELKAELQKVESDE